MLFNFSKGSLSTQRMDKNISELAELGMRIAAGFVNLAPKQLDNQVEAAIAELGQALDIDRAAIYQYRPDRMQVTNTHEWCRSGIKPLQPEQQDMDPKRYRWLFDKVLQQERLELNDPEQLPPAASMLKGDLKKRNIKTVLCLPLIYHSEAVGCFWLESSQPRAKWEQRVVDILITMADIFTRSLAHRARIRRLYQAEQLYRLLFDNLNEGIVICRDEQIILANPQMSRMLGYPKSELSGKHYRELFTSAGLKILSERQRRQKAGQEIPPQWETSVKKSDGTGLDVEADIHTIDDQDQPITILLLRDITHRRQREQYQHKLELDLLKQQKRHSYDLFAGGIVHNIKNFLTVITGRAQLLKGKHPELKEPAIIIKNANNIATIADNFLSKVKKEQITKRVDINLNELIRNEIAFLESNTYYKSSVDKHLQLDRQLPAIRGHYSDFSHSLSIFLLRALQSLEKSKRKELTVRTAAETGKITITIADSGTAIPQEQLNGIFNPFYSLSHLSDKVKPSAREVEHLHLFQAYLLLEPYGANIRAESSPEEGNTFHIVIPVK